MTTLIADYQAERRAILDLFQLECECRIVLFRGGSGSGKTTLLAHCQEQTPASVFHLPIQLRGSTVTAAEVFIAYPQARQRYEDALPIYRAIGARLGEANCIKSLGDVHVRLAEYPQARQRYEDALPIYRAIGARLGEANCIRCLGDVHIAEGDEVAALAAYEDAFARYLALGLPDNAAGALTGQTTIHERRHDYAAALPLYTRAIELAPDNPMWHRNRANAYLNLKDAARAAADIETAARLQPEHPYLHLHRGNLAILRGDYDAALVELAAFAAAFPNSNGSHFALARGHLLRRDAPAALDAIERVLALTYEAQDVRDTVYDLEEMRGEHGDLPGLAEALARLRRWLTGKQP